MYYGNVIKCPNEFHNNRKYTLNQAEKSFKFNINYILKSCIQKKTLILVYSFDIAVHFSSLCHAALNKGSRI